MERQNPTNPDTLTPQQEAAADLLAAGKTITEAAEAVGVSRQTVSEWRNQHHGFRIVVNQRRQELWAAATERLRNIVPKALDVIERRLTDGNDLHAAVAVLKAAGLHELGEPTGATTPEAARLEDAERENKMRQRTLFAVFPR